jgi:hypothetical protein
MLLLLTAGCGAKEQPQAQVINPIQAVESAADFQNTLGIYLSAPESGENPSYSIISGQIAQIRYTWQEKDFTLRCAETTEDISGVYGPFIPYDSMGILIEYGSELFTVRTKYPTDGGALALWQIGEYSYSLYTADEMEPSAFDDYAAGIARTYLELDHPAP